MSFLFRSTDERINLIDIVINRFSDLLTDTAACAAVGFLGTHLVKHFNFNLMTNPQVGLACGAAAGMIAGLFGTKHSNTSSKIVGLAALIFIPFRFCKRLNLPITFQATLATTAVTLISTYLIALLFVKIGVEMEKRNFF